MLDHHNHNHHHQMENYPRDLLQRFVNSSGGGGGSDENTHTEQQHPHHHHHHHHHHHQQQQHHHHHHQHQQQQQQQQHQEQVEQHEEEEEDDDEELELNLGLSLGGRFGVDKHARKKKLTRSSSVVGTIPLRREDRPPEPPEPPHPAAYPAVLMRTSSLPTEAEEEWRKRKELQTLRRMEAKRRRSEKQRASRSERESSVAGGGGLEDVEGASATTMGTWSSLGSSSPTAAPPPPPPPPPFGIPGWGAGGRQVVLSDVLGRGKLGRGSGSSSSGSGGLQGLFAQISSQGSADSHGGSSSSLSEMESMPFAGPRSCGEARSPASNQSLQERSGQDAGGSSGTKTIEGIIRISRAEVENPSKKHNPAENKGREIGTNSVENMPCVFTKGDGPNGRRIEGILYKYGKGEEVRIMCVCHGDFLSPAEFVKHAGGSDVAHPLKHIVVYSSASPFL